jgi:hypothetical protein
MKYTKSLSAKELVQNQLMVKETVVLLALSAALPFLAHLIPAVNGTPMGAILLPIFYAPLIGVILFRFHVGVLVAALAPFINLAIIGMPSAAMASLLAVELVMFVGFTQLFLQNDRLKWVSAPVSLVLVKLVSSLMIMIVPFWQMINTGGYLVNSLVNGVAGIFVLLLLNIALLKFKK